MAADVAAMCASRPQTNTRLLRRFRAGRRRRRGGFPEGAFLLVCGIRRHRLITPEPAHHAGENRAALFLTVVTNAPHVVHVVAFLGEGLHEADVLVEPIAFGIGREPIVVSTIL